MSEPIQTVPGPENSGQKKDNNRNLTPLLILIIALLLASNAWFYFNGKHTESVQTTKINADSARIKELEDDYKKALTDLNSYKNQDSTLNDSIRSIMTKFENVRAALIKAHASGQMSQAMYDKEKKLLQDKIKELMDQVTTLNTKLNKQLVRNDSLGKAVADQEMKNTSLTKDLKASKAINDVASALHARSIEAYGVKVKNSGKEIETSHASKTDKIKISFSVDENRVTEAGKKTIYVRVITPEGTPIYNESEGSGITVLNSGEKLRYSVKGDFDYNNAEKQLGMYVKSSTGYAKGTYKIELYERGYQIGTGNFTLK